jgi:hypothetical protein
LGVGGFGEGWEACGAPVCCHSGRVGVWEVVRFFFGTIRLDVRYV